MIVRFHQATLALGGRPVLSGLDLALHPGELVGLLGPNGAGKTTLLRAILGLVPPSAGTVHVFGRPATRGNPGIGYMPQTRGDTALRLRGRDVLAAGADGHRWGLPWPGPATRRDIDRALELVDATQLADRPMADLSGGERQRLLLAQALLGAPKLLLLDEPLTHLDPAHQAALVALVARLRSELGLAILFGAHDLNPLLGAIDRVLYVAGGRATLGSVDTVVTGPALTALYGTSIEVVRAQGRVFVLPSPAPIQEHAAVPG